MKHNDQPRCPAPNPWRAVAAAAFIALAGLAAPQAYAQVNLLTVINGSDGTEGFDSNDPTDPTYGKPGYDGSPNNQIVRTNDEFTYKVTFRTDSAAGDTNVRIVSTLPGTEAEWVGLPSSCDGAGSEISADKKTLTCVVSNVTPSTTLDIFFGGVVLGNVPNGATIAPPTTTLTSTGRPTPLDAAQNPGPLAVTAAPFYDVVVQRSYQGNPMAYGFRDGSGPGGETGAYHRPLVGLVARHPNGHGRKGVEQLDGSPIQIQLDVSGYPDTVRLNNWSNGTDTFALTAPGGGACGSPANGSPNYVLGGAVNMYQRVNDAGVPDGANNTVPNGGSCAVSMDASKIITMTLTGVDTSLARRPTHQVGGAGGFTVPASEWWVANKALVLWTDLASYPASGTEVQHPISLVGITANSISNQPVSTSGGELTTNNSDTWAMYNITRGSFSKYYTPDGAPGLNWRPWQPPYSTVKDPGVNGDDYVNDMAVNQYVSGRLVYNNSGSVTHTGVYLCEIIDRTAFDLPANLADLQVVSTGHASTGATLTLRYGARAAGLGPYFSSTDSADTSITNGAPGDSEYSKAKCNDPTIQWFATAADAEAAGGLVYVRAEVDRVPAGAIQYLYVRGLKLRETWASTIQVLSPVATTRTAGQPIEAGTIIRNRGDGFSGSANITAIDNGVYRDHLLVVPSRTTSRVSKSVINPANATTVPVGLGSTVRYRLQPRFSTTFPPISAEYLVEDVLPPGLSYVPGSATVAGAAQEPTVAADTPATGYTTLTWSLGSKTPHLGGDADAGALLEQIEFDATVAYSVPNDSTLRNHTAVHSLLANGGTNDYEARCVFDATGAGYGACNKAGTTDIRVLATEGFRVEKRTDTATIYAGEQFQYTVTYTPLLSDITGVNIPHWIDILPFVGDGVADPARSFEARSPASQFDSGAYGLHSVTVPSNDANATVYYTNRAHAEVDNDPRDASNDLNTGSTRWCLAGQFGMTGCPTSMAEVTAVRVAPGLTRLTAGTPYALTLRFDTDAVIAKGGDVFNNGVAGHSPDAGSSLQLVYAQSIQPVRINQRGSISGFVYEDVNTSGVRDAGDQPIAGNGVALYGCAAGLNGQLDTTDVSGAVPLACAGDDVPVERTTTTAADGSYSFPNLPEGLYTVVQPAQPSGYDDAQTNVGSGGGVVPAGGNRINNIGLTGTNALTDYNFGEVLQGALPAPTIVANDDNMGSHSNSAVVTTPSVLADNGGGTDKANGVDAVLGATANVVLTPGAAPTPAAGGIAMSPTTGVITVAAGTTPGTYSYPYTICLVAAPTVCDPAVATITVTAATAVPTIVANDDNMGSHDNGAVVTTPSVLADNGNSTDKANGADAVLGATPNVVLTPGAAPTPVAGSITMSPTTGVITVAAGTTPGTYSYPYTICLTASPSTCDTATATVTVTAVPVTPPQTIVANDDDMGTHDNATAVTTPSVLADNSAGTDKANGADAVVGTNVTLIPGTAPHPGLVMNPDGTITIAAGTPADVYVYPYQICLLPATSPATCATANATVTLTAKPAIVAVNDVYAGISSSGGTTPSVLGSDSASGNPATSSNVTLVPGTLDRVPASGSIVMNPDGTITVAPNTTPGTYSYSYTICLVTAPTVCASAVATLQVIGEPTPVPGNAPWAVLLAMLAMLAVAGRAAGWARK